jgi:hypothetical protein
MFRPVHWTRLAAALLCLIGSTAGASSVESLLMPGPLTAKHAKYEDTCTDCHDRANRARQSELCLACHKDIAAGVQQKRGLHGRMSNAGTAGQCRACHTDHKGRGADIIGMSVAQFDHGRTDFALEGAHRPLACVACHRSGSAYRAATPTCIACHRSADYHNGQLGTDCASCHGNVTWAGARFDHAKTGFELSGAHQDLGCGACHLGGTYKPTPKTCNGCHQTDDAHRGERGVNCADCHTTRDWRGARFDHAKETGFALLGAHAPLACQTCHRSGDYKQKLPKDCFGCHRADDSHATRFGERCADCHGADAWKPVSYDHAQRAKYALEGAHARLGCHTCHTAPVAQQKLATSCAQCHVANNPHGKGLKVGCETCHNTTAWKPTLSFDHDLTSFPLLGQHVLAACAQCHRTLDFSAAPTGCRDCHAKQDVHDGKLGAKCDSCHNPNAWSIWKFDHAKQTGFALTGAHAMALCADCHRKPAGEVKLVRDCVACHQQDDIHNGQFGRQCERCHTTVTFTGGRAR